MQVNVKVFVENKQGSLLGGDKEAYWLMEFNVAHSHKNTKNRKKKKKHSEYCHTLSKWIKTKDANLSDGELLCKGTRLVTYVQGGESFPPLVGHQSYPLWLY